MHNVIRMLCALIVFSAASAGAAQTLGASGAPFAITNVRVFDGWELTEQRTVVVENGLISSALTAEIVVEGQGGMLLPGLIDTHIHVDGKKSLEEAAQWGVTTMLDMGTPFAMLKSLCGLPGLPDLRGSGISAAPPNGAHAVNLGCAAVSTTAEAEAFVAARMAEGCDYIKVIVDSPGLNAPPLLMNEEALAAMVKTAHANKLRVVGHVTSVASVALAVRTDVDVLTHAPLGAPIERDLARAAVEKQILAIPTLIMMKGIFAALPEQARRPGMGYDNAELSLQALQLAGMPVLAGTDANTAPKAPAMVPHGESLHDELELLTRAGLSPIAALRAATTLPAVFLDLPDRGRIAPDKRADLVLVKGDPTEDITATRSILGVWIQGERVR